MKKILKILAIIFSLIIGIGACGVIFGDDTATDTTQISATTVEETTSQAETTVTEQTATTETETTTEKETTIQKETTTERQTTTTEKVTTTQKETTTKKPTATKKETTTRKPTTTKKVEQSPSNGEMVWIPTNGGTKYHTHSGCSNMDSPSHVTLAEAKRLGFTACKRCYG